MFFFEIKVKHETTISPLREYILEWLKEALIKVTELENQETIEAVMPTQPTPTSTKGMPQRNKILRDFSIIVSRTINLSFSFLYIFFFYNHLPYYLYFLSIL
jgi:hypothetical protein